MFFWQREEVLITNSLEQYSNVLRALKCAGIRCDIKSVSSGSNVGRGNSYMGRIGERTNLEIMYYVYVKKEDAEQAQHVIEQEKHRYK